MKPNKFFAIFLFVSFAATSCVLGSGYSYKGNNRDLYTVTVNNIFGISGVTSNGEVNYDPIIEIKEQDSYGRTLFLYQEAVSSKSASYLGGVIIMQSSNDESAFSYDNCYIPLYEATTLPVDFDKAFDKDAIAQLKSDNDWGKEINNELLREYPLSSHKPSGKLKVGESTFEKVLKKYARSQGYKGNDSLYRYSKYAQADRNGKELYYVYGVGRDVEGEGVSTTSKTQYFHLAVIVNEDKSCPEENVSGIKDAKEASQLIKALKEKVGWK